MALRHRHKRRSWHWTRRELGMWNPAIGVLANVFDSMAETFAERMKREILSLTLGPMTIKPEFGSSLGQVVFSRPPGITWMIDVERVTERRDDKFNWDTRPITMTFDDVEVNEAGWNLLHKMSKDDGLTNATQESGPSEPIATGDEA